MFGRVRLIVDGNEPLFIERFDRRNVDRHITKRGVEGSMRRRADAKKWHKVRRSNDDRALDPAM